MHHQPHRSHRFGLGRGIGAGLALALAAWLGACAPPTFEDSGQNGGSGAGDSATVRFINLKTQDSGTIDFYRFGPGTQDVQPETPRVFLAAVDYGKDHAVDVKVPAGKWKFAYTPHGLANGFQTMPKSDTALVDDDAWPALNLQAGTGYFIQVETDGNRDFWTWSAE